MNESWVEWLTQNAQPQTLAPTRDRVLDAAHISPGDVVLDVGAGIGLMADAARSRGAEVIALEPDDACRAELQARGLRAVSGRAEQIPLEDSSIDVAVCRSVLIYVDSLDAAARELCRVLKRDGRFSAFEPLNRESTYIHDVIDWTATGIPVAEDDRKWLLEYDPLSRLDVDELVRALEYAGFVQVEPTVEAEDDPLDLTPELVDAMLDAVGAPGQPSRRERWTTRYGRNTTTRLVEHLKAHAGETFTLRWVSLLVTAYKP